MRDLAGRLRLEYAQFLELELFTRFGATADERTRRSVERGRRIRELLRQPRMAPLPLGVQVAQLLAVARGVIDTLDPEQVPDFRAALPAALARDAARIVERLEASGELSDADADVLARMLANVAGALGGAAPAAAGPTP